jgi:VIT1/CCC1 family predicted Fe2+/Mn2+ transporter
MPLEDVRLRNLEHKVNKSGWLRAAVLGVNDGLVSTAAIMIGVSAAAKNDFLVTAGIAAIVAGAMSMAVGEYVSVSSQTDIENADRELEIKHLEMDPEGELEELTEIYIKRGLSPDLAKKVALELHQHDALEAHLRDELGQFEHTKARPLQAAIASAISFSLGGCIPFLGALAPTPGKQAFSIVLFTLIGLLISGALSARAAGVKYFNTTLRIVTGGCLGMLITAGIGSLTRISGL